MDAKNNKNPFPINTNEVYQIDGRHSIWRDPDGALRHDSTVGPSIGERAGMETEHWARKEHGNLNLEEMERAHTLGQGTGFESPYGIFFAPRIVNQVYQRTGIEGFLAQAFKSLPKDESLHVVTKTLVHPRSLRLARIEYLIEITDATGKRSTLFKYVITVGNDVPNLTTAQRIISVSDPTKVRTIITKTNGADRMKKLLRDFMDAVN